MNNVKLLYIKCCFFQFFNSPVALKNKKKFGPPRKSWNDAPELPHGCLDRSTYKFFNLLLYPELTIWQMTMHTVKSIYVTGVCTYINYTDLPAVDSVAYSGEGIWAMTPFDQTKSAVAMEARGTVWCGLLPLWNPEYATHCEFFTPTTTAASVNSIDSRFWGNPGNLGGEFDGIWGVEFDAFLWIWGIWGVNFYESGESGGWIWCIFIFFNVFRVLGVFLRRGEFGILGVGGKKKSPQEIAENNTARQLSPVSSCRPPNVLRAAHYIIYKPYKISNFVQLFLSETCNMLKM